MTRELNIHLHPYRQHKYCGGNHKATLVYKALALVAPTWDRSLVGHVGLIWHRPRVVPNSICSNQIVLRSGCIETMLFKTCLTILYLTTLLKLC